MKHLLTIIALALIGLNAHAGLNKWVDAEGKVHYSDTPPPEVKTESVRNISGKGQVEAPASYSPKSIAEREADLRKSKLEKEESAQKKSLQDAEMGTKKRNCENARHNERAIEEGSRISTYDEKGERTYLDDDARAQRLEEARKAIAANCN
ncbi:MAG: DUF4124 domain-containing protein [Nitrosomonadales bacterium]|nr:DUF4124 domain-containing protein [Nitrosomonadales bacterium]